MSWKHKGFQIEVNHNGDFYAQVNDAEIKAGTLDQVKKEIEAEVGRQGKPALSLKVIGISRYTGYASKEPPDMVARALLTGINRTTRNLQFSGLGKDTTLVDVVADTPANEEFLTQLLEVRLRKDELEKQLEKKELKPGGCGYGRVEAADYPKWIEDLKKKHAEQLG